MIVVAHGERLGYLEIETFEDDELNDASSLMFMFSSAKVATLQMM